MINEIEELNNRLKILEKEIKQNKIAIKQLQEKLGVELKNNINKIEKNEYKFEGYTPTYDEKTIWKRKKL